MQSKLLCDIDTPSDLRKLTANQLPQLCEEVRAFIIEELSKNPGHFASSLGAVELTVALHYVYNTPEDRIVWDVGHQAYAHKILTGRRDRFCTNRKLGGICGFPSRDESPYDAFVGGHASVSISAALGMAVASQKEGSNRQVIAVIGDGSMTGGLAFEGLNNASSTPNDLLIILNDNNMAIDSNVGGLSRYLLGLSTSKFYNRLRNKAYAVLVEHQWLNPSRKGAYTRLMNSVKSFLTNRNSLFEGLNIRYFGPIDGHNVHELTNILEEMKHIRGPKLLHVITKKGKGYAPAEESATEWHAPGRFNPQTGERILSKGQDPPLFQNVFGETIIELAQQDKRIVGITPAMPTGCSLNMMSEVLPDRVFDVGIAEAHAVTFSAGLATEGMIPFCNIYSSFLQRSYDQIIHDVALQKLPVIFCLDRAGLVGEDGATHHGAYDLSYLRCIPNLVISAPMDEPTLRHLMLTAVTQRENPFAIRYPRGKGVTMDWRVPMQLLPIGKGRTLKQTESSTAVLSIGAIGNEAAEAIATLESEGKNYSHYDMIFVKPLDTELIDQICRTHRTLVTIEDGSLAGGFGSAVLEYVSEKEYAVKVVRIGIPDRFILHGSVAELRHECGIDAASIAQRLRGLHR